MSTFWSSFLSNFLGSLGAGVLVALLAFLFITYRLDIQKPRKERIGEQHLVCDLLIAELRDFHRIVAAVQNQELPADRFPPLQTGAWEALKGSQAMRFLPLECLAALLGVYSRIYNLQRWMLRAEDLRMTAWTSGGGSAQTGASILVKQLAAEVAKLLLSTDKQCVHVIELLELAKRNLKFS